MAIGQPMPLVIGGTIQLPYGDETYVYRAYCKCGDVLYVGMTNDLFTRLAKHRRELAPWLSKVDRIEWDLYRHRAEAEVVERHTIREQAPLHNVTHARLVARPKPLPWPRFLTFEDQNRRAICAFRGEPFLPWLFAVESWGRPA